MSNLILEIRKLIEHYIYKQYEKYLIENNILLIKSDNIKTIVTQMYNDNHKNIKQHIRNSLKESMKQDYPSGVVENILVDIFQDREMNILKLTKIIDDYQKSNYFEIEKPIHDKQLGISINFDGSFCEIGFVKDNTFPDKDIIEKYIYLYSIDNHVLNEQKDIINSIKTIISRSTKVNIGVYKLITED